MRTGFGCGLALLACFVCGSATLVANEAAGPHDWLVKHPTIQELLRLTNEERARNGLDALRLNTKMCLAAQKHAVWMAETGFYQHSDLPWAEVIFQGPLNAEEAITGWTYSPPHYAVLLSGSEIGFGYTNAGGATHWVGVVK